ncbi:hypothetical protein TWF718_000071 [Orbilia javanica]|uniref:F-box domain-containing protein n=1 Tax=Orbilia javanica TaxID=47235 RepID=A0AAN8RLQ3_9PEZI
MARSSYLLQLPEEVLVQILSTGGLSPKHFVALSRVCQRMHRLAVGYLYRDFFVSHGLSYNELDGFCKFGVYTRILEVNYTPNMLTADKTFLNTTRGFPNFVTTFPNITKFIFSDSMGISFSHFLYIIRKTLTINIRLTHAEFHSRVPAKGVTLKNEVRNLLEQPQICGDGAEFAKLARLVIAYIGNKDSYRKREMDTAERMEGFRRAIGRSMESVIELGVFVTSHVRRPPGQEGGYKENGWGSKGLWEIRKVKKLDVAVDCWPYWEMGFVDLRGEQVEELTIGVRGVKGEEVGWFSDVPDNLYQRFPKTGVLKIFGEDRIGADLTLQVSDLRDIANSLPFLRRIMWFSKLGEGDEHYPDFLTERKVFLVERMEGVGGRADIKEVGGWEASREGIAKGFLWF